MYTLSIVPQGTNFQDVNVFSSSGLGLSMNDYILIDFSVCDLSHMYLYVRIGTFLGHSYKFSGQLHDCMSWDDVKIMM